MSRIGGFDSAAATVAPNSRSSGNTGGSLRLDVGEARVLGLGESDHGRGNHLDVGGQRDRRDFFLGQRVVAGLELDAEAGELLNIGERSVVPGRT